MSNEIPNDHTQIQTMARKKIESQNIIFTNDIFYAPLFQADKPGT